MTKVLDHAKKGESFEVPMDVISTPTSALTLAKFVELMIDRTEYGIYHASCEGSCSAVPSHSTSSSPTAMTSGLRKACSPARSPCRPCSKTS